MASNKKSNYSAKVKYWSDGIVGEMSGGIAGCIGGLFTALPREQREKVMQSLAEKHVNVCQWEDEKAAKAIPAA